MARQTKPLTDTEINKAKPREKDYKLTDGMGLYLLVTKAGGKHWKLKYSFEGKEQKVSLGAYPLVSLVDARGLRDEHKRKLLNGINPAYELKEKKEAEKIEEIRNLNTFEKIARDRLAKVENEISESHYKRTLRGLENDVFPLIGNMPINDIQASDIIKILQTMMKRDVKDSTKKVYHSISKIFKWAVAHGIATRNPANDIQASEIIGKQKIVNYPTITDDAGIRGLLLAIDSYQGEYTTKQALKFMAYVFVRTINIRHAEWSEIDFKTKQWIIPADKMKTRNALIVPLTDSAITILEDMKQYSGDGKYIFPSLKSKTAPMSDNTLLGAIRRLGYTKEEFTPHGFRSMFSTIAHEKSKFNHEVIETQLAHSVGNNVSKAYNRAKYLDERVELMQWWSDYLDELISAEVVE